MAPRTSAKKEPPTLWYQCEQCHVNITSKDREQHCDQHCPIQPDAKAATAFSTSYVHDQHLYAATVSNKIPSDASICDLPAAQLNGFVFVSESTMSVCGWILGDLVALRSPQLATDRLPAAVRSVWPVSDRLGATVFVTEDEIQSTWRGVAELQLVISKYDGIAAPAADIAVAAADNTSTNIDAPTWSAIRSFIGQQFYNRSVSVGTRLAFEFFNKRFAFDVRSCIAADHDELQSRLNALELNDDNDDGGNSDSTPIATPFYTITKSTQFRLERSSDEDSSSDSTNANASDASTLAMADPLRLIGGLDDTVRQLNDLAALAFGRITSLRGIQISRSVLIHGLPGCGKTLLCDAIAAQSRAQIVRLNASDIFSKYFGETEANLRSHFDRAMANYPRPTVLIIEEIVNVCANGAKEDSAKRVTAAFLNALDALHTRREGSRVLVLATTANVENINPAARRCGRLDVEIEIGVPNPDARAEILQKHVDRVANGLSREEVRELAGQCHGFVGSDLASLVAKAALHATNARLVKRDGDGDDDAEPIRLQLADIQQVFGLVKPSAMREVLIECPNVKWSDIGGQEELKLKLKQAIEWPLTNPERFLRMGIQPPRGILMFGPPGCSKTMIAKALATESKVNFLSIKGPELFSMWVGESEKAVRDLFRKARSVAPAIIFFDEIDAIGGERAGGTNGGGAGSSVKERVLAQLLTEMDGVQALQNVTIVAATNRPDLIDTALMRPGRIDRIVYVRLPDAATRAEIFAIKMRKMPVAADVDVRGLVERTEGYSGAEVQAVCQEAALKALEEDFDTDNVKARHFERALAMVQRRTSADLLRLYDNYLLNF